VDKLKKFQDFVDSKINESDGFGTYPFLLKKEGDLYYYFYQLELENGGQKGFMLVVGKYSKYETLEGPKNSHAVLNINEISPEIIEDIAINKEDIPEINEEKFSLSDNNLSRFMEQISKCLDNYLNKNPKVVRIFDEMSDNLEIENYEEYFRSIVLSNLGKDWSMQDGSTKEVFIISR
jgi:hypothetical protein